MGRQKLNWIGVYFLYILFLFLLFCPHFARAKSSSIVINELYFNVLPDKGTDSEDEWLELYNVSSQPINLKNWQIFDNKTLRTISLVDLVVPGEGFVLISKNLSTWDKWKNELPEKTLLGELGARIGNGLGNSGDRLILYDDLRNQVDEISWGNDKAFYNLPGIAKGHSIERREVGLDRDLSSDFIDNPAPTPGKSWQKPVYSEDIHLSEISPAPLAGSDSEFIEIYNDGQSIVDLSGWTLVDNIGAKFIITEKRIAGGEFLVLPKKITRISLNDNGDKIQLLDPGGDLKSEVVFTLTKTGQSLIFVDGSWQWSAQVTEGAQNVLFRPDNDDPFAVFAQDEPSPTPIQAIDQGLIDKYVQIGGTVTKTEGDSFVLSESNKEMKVVIREITGIEKPKMHSGDLALVSGVVSLYRNQLRVLPIRQDDVKIINHKPAEIPATGQKIMLPDTGADLKVCVISLTLIIIIWNIFQRAKRKPIKLPRILPRL